MARVVAGHLLDVGYSQRYLSRWLKQEQASSRLLSLPEFIRDAHRLATLPPIPYSVLVPVNAGLRRGESPEGWLDAAGVKTLLSQVNVSTKNLRFGGGWLIPTLQRDPYSAAYAAFDEFDRRAARLLVGRGQSMVPIGKAYVFGEPRTVLVEYSDNSHRVRVGSIERQNQVFSRTTSKVDAAFELLAQLDGSAAVAVAAGWAAIESLLVAPPEEKVMAARRLSALVTASFPRAELTSLAAAHIRQKTETGTRLRLLAKNRERAKELAFAIVNGSAEPLVSWSDRAATERMKLLLARPKEQVNDVLVHVERVFRRLYRQRNLVLHWGKTDPVALRAGLRTGAPLLAAGIDRIAHAWFLRDIDPVQLAIRAKSRLDLAGLTGRSAAELLDGIE